MTGGVVLAGGRSTRMGVNKSLMKFDGKPLVARTVEILDDLCNEIVVSINSEQKIESYSSILPKRVKIVQDISQDQTPVLGIASSLRHIKSKYSIILSCDLPFLNKKVLEHLLNESEDFSAAIPRWPDGGLEPLHSVYETIEARDAAKDAFMKKEFSNFDIIKRLKRVKFIPAENLRALDPALLTFINVNTRSEFNQALKKLG